VLNWRFAMPVILVCTALSGCALAAIIAAQHKASSTSTLKVDGQPAAEEAVGPIRLAAVEHITSE
jgi:hypothetical protein